MKSDVLIQDIKSLKKFLLCHIELKEAESEQHDAWDEGWVAALHHILSVISPRKLL